jgi:ATP-dependent DNA ligase
MGPRSIHTTHLDSLDTLDSMTIPACLWLDEGDLRAQTLHVRRKRLEHVLGRAPAVLLPVRRLSDEGLKAWQQVIDHGYERMVAKDPQSPYVAGRTLKWLKVKQREYRVEERGWDPGKKS